MTTSTRPTSSQLLTLGTLHNWHSGNQLIYGPGAQNQFALDSLNVGITTIVVLCSPYPVIRVGLSPSTIQAGATVTIATYPLTTLRGVNTVKIGYEDSDLLDSTGMIVGESSLQIFEWSDTELKWLLIGGDVDTTDNVVYTQIDQAGIYAAFTTDQFECGDANGDAAVDISDAVSLIAYIFSGRSGTKPAGVRRRQLRWGRGYL